MDRSNARILDDALKLPLEARAALAASLIDSLDDHADPDAEAAWEAEISKRIRELDSGSTTPIPWSEARRAITSGE